MDINLEELRTKLRRGVNNSLREKQRVFMVVVDDEIVGYYTDLDHGDNFPEGAIEISQEAWQCSIEQNHTHYRNGIFTREPTKWDREMRSIMEKNWRDKELKDTDKYTAPDFPIEAETRQQMNAYRQELRDYNYRIECERPTRPSAK